MFAPCFAGLNGVDGSVDLTSIGVSGYEAGTLFGEISFQILNSAGTDGDTYQYLDLEGEFAPGWYTMDYDPVEPNTVMLTTGQGLWTTSISGAKFTFSGQVITMDCVIPLIAGSIAMGNMMATDVDLTDILVTGYEEGTLFGDISFQILNASGTDGDTYQYLDLEGEFAPGWYTMDYDPVGPDTVVFAPGDGIWVTGIAGAYFTFPAPEL